MKPTFAIALAPLVLPAVALSYQTPATANSPTLAPTPANASTSSQTPTFSFNQLWDLNKKFLENFIYPADIVQAQAINSTLLSEDVLGRIDITRTFKGRELNTEYLFGLFANLASVSPGAISLLGIPLSYEIVHFTANQNIVSSLTRSVSLQLLSLFVSFLHKRPGQHTTQISVQILRPQPPPPARDSRLEHVQRARRNFPIRRHVQELAVGRRPPSSRGRPPVRYRQQHTIDNPRAAAGDREEYMRD